MKLRILILALLLCGNASAYQAPMPSVKTIIYDPAPVFRHYFFVFWSIFQPN